MTYDAFDAMLGQLEETSEPGASEILYPSAPASNTGNNFLLMQHYYSSVVTGR